MKHSTLIITLCCTSVITAMAQSTPRNTLWLQGAGPTSGPWDNAILYARNQILPPLPPPVSAYNFVDINDYVYYTNQAPTIQVCSNDMVAELNNGNYTDVLGIGHDFGGLVLRKMNQSTNRLSAMILDGVPNQGSKAIEKILPKVNVSEVKNRLQTIRSYVGANSDCQQCNIVGATETFVDQVISMQNTYREMTADNPVFQSLGQPTIPHAVIWGNEDSPISLSMAMTSNGNYFNNGDDVGDRFGYVKCFEEQIQKRTKALKDKTITRNTNFILNFAKVVIAVIKEDLASYIENLLNTAVKYNQEIRERDKELAALLSCELMQEAINAEWHLIVTGQPILVTETILVPEYDYDCCEPCYDEPDSQVQGDCFSACQNGGASCNYPPLVPYTYSYYAIEPHDALLTRSEQQLAGALGVYEAKKTNHWQEMFWQQNDIKSAFQDLFNGGAGAAFVVPKQ
ncbi:MAG: hypothetical protein ACOYNO_01940 [Saprospiraceae bacterium]